MRQVYVMRLKSVNVPNTLALPKYFVILYSLMTRMHLPIHIDTRCDIFMVGATLYIRVHIIVILLNAIVLDIFILTSLWDCSRMVNQYESGSRFTQNRTIAILPLILQQLIIIGKLFLHCLLPPIYCIWPIWLTSSALLTRKYWFCSLA